MNIKRKLFVLMTVFVGFTLVTGMSATTTAQGDFGIPTEIGVSLEDNTQQLRDARVRVAHMGADYPGFDVLFNGTSPGLSFDGFTFGSHTAYAAFDSTVAHNVTVVETGTTTVLFNLTTTFDRGADYTIIGTATNSTNIGSVVVMDDNSPVEEDTSRIYLSHLSADAGNITITANDTVLLENVTYGAAATFELAAGSYDFIVNASGSDGTGTYENHTASAINFNAGGSYNVLAAGNFTGASSDSFDLLVEESTVRDARIKFAHAIPDAPAVDLFADGGEVAADVGFTESADYFAPLAPGVAVEYNISENIVDNANAELLSTEVTPLQATDYTLFAMGSMYDGTAELFPVENDNSAVAEGMSRIQFVHASPSTPFINVVLNGTSVSDNIEYQETRSFTVAEGYYEVQLVDSKTGELIGGVSEITVTSEGSYTTFASGFYLDQDTVSTTGTVTEVITGNNTVTETETETETETASAEDTPVDPLFAMLGLSTLAVTVYTIRKRN